ncbi:MAG TPA: response regulator transcription factor [Candidatus Omnitrophota bacterium]|nr:response regulator transcription factor [Candidatus Omnitrophota bacterium]
MNTNGDQKSIETRILVVDDDETVQILVQRTLGSSSVHVLSALNGIDAVRMAQEENPDLIILDVCMPLMDGKEVIKELRRNRQTQMIPVMMLTGNGMLVDKIVGFELGADDYVTKPFSPKVLLARIKAVARRLASKQTSEETREIGGLKIDTAKHKITYQNQLIELTTIEFNILEFLSRHPGRVFNRDQIMDRVWKEGRFIIDRAVDVHIRGLRKKMGKAAELIETVRGAGYRFKDLEDIHE